jgi:hypothetical protein
MRKLKQREIKGVRDDILQKQGHKCAICLIDLPNDAAVLDHSHVTGAVRGALCRNCNGIEGKVHNLARRAQRKFNAAWWIGRLLKYWASHETDQTGLMHPTHRTADDKRLRANKLARERRASAKV